MSIWGGIGQDFDTGNVSMAARARQIDDSSLASCSFFFWSDPPSIGFGWLGGRNAASSFGPASHRLLLLVEVAMPLAGVGFFGGAYHDLYMPFCGSQGRSGTWYDSRCGLFPTTDEKYRLHCPMSESYARDVMCSLYSAPINLRDAGRDEVVHVRLQVQCECQQPSHIHCVQTGPSACLPTATAKFHALDL